MEIFLTGHDYKYAAEQMMLMLYPAERPVYPGAPSGGNALYLHLDTNENVTAASCRLILNGQEYNADSSVPLPEGCETARLEQRALKLAFYRAALLSGREKPVWGCLTGVRPAKFMAALMQKDGLTLSQAKDALTQVFDVSPERAELCAHACEDAEEARASLAEGDLCLYIGIPFCPTRCAYCSFVSVDAPGMLSRIPEYLDALERELSAVAVYIKKNNKRIVALYVGGGTPTTLSATELERLLSYTESCFDLSACREITVEAGRPDTVTAEKLQVLLRHHVNRVSVNPQSMNDAVLSAIGRRHTVAQVYEAVELVRRAGGLALNMDLIAGLPGDTPESFAATVDAVLSLAPENITVHTLALKKSSYFLLNPTALPGGDDVARMLEYSNAKLSSAEYEPYYLYRQKFMSGSFENVGWTLPGYSNLYNICIMEELCTVVSCGAGGSTKLVYPGGRVERLCVPKYPREYMERIDEICARKEQMK